MSTFSFTTAQTIISGMGEVKHLAAHFHSLKIRRVLIITDPGIVLLGLHNSAIESCNSAGIESYIFSDVSSDPSESVINDALKYARENRIDGVVGIGGGSSLDVAKIVAVLAYSSQNLSDIYGVDQVEGERLPLIQIPTTAGTGSEVTPISIVTVGDKTKAGIISPQLLPDIAILDAQLTLGLPPHITAATGIDAMVHAIEAFTSKFRKNLYSDMLAKESLALLSSNIEAAVFTGQDKIARTNMMIGALLAGQAFANAPVAAVHALAYPLGSCFHIPHGLSNALVLPHVLRFNAKTASNLYASLAPIIIPHFSGLELSAQEKTLKLIEYIEGLIPKLGLPTRLRELSIEKHDLEYLAEAAMDQQRLLINNPREVSQADAFDIYTAAF